MGPSNFECDRPAKNDFTASTTIYLEKHGYRKPCQWYEEDIYGHMCEYGSPSADPQSRIDVYLNYGGVFYAIELKERGEKYPSTYPRIVNEGSYYNYEKDCALKECQKKGYIPLFGELYCDGVIRVWNVGRIDASELAVETTSIRRYTVDPSSPKKVQNRLLLPVSAACEYKRIKSIS